MARLNIEDEWWIDPRRRALTELIGCAYTADGVAMSAWRIGQEYWAKDRRRVPLKVFQLIKYWEHLLTIGLAESEGEFVYISGTKERAEFRLERSDAGRTGGRVSAQRPRDEKGRLLPKCDALSKQTSKQNPSSSKLVQASTSSSSSSSSKSNTKIPSEQTAVAAAPPGTQLAMLPNEAPKPAPAKRDRWGDGTREKMRQFYAAYSEGYRAKYGGQPEAIRDKAILGKVGAWIEHVSADRATALIQAYLQIDYRPIAESQHDLWNFFRHLNRIGNALNSGNPGEIDWGKVFGVGA